jgi:hypothetical protein
MDSPTKDRIQTVSLLQNSITLTWLTRVSSGCLPVLGYYLQINSGYDTDYTSELHYVDPTTSKYTFENLIAGVNYKFRIAAFNLIESQNRQHDDNLNFSDPSEYVIANVPDQITTFA